MPSLQHSPSPSTEQAEDDARHEDVGARQTAPSSTQQPEYGSAEWKIQVDRERNPSWPPRPGSMAWKFWVRPPGGHFVPSSPSSNINTDPFLPAAGTYFFYGTLQDPSVLRQVLGLTADPVLRPAQIQHYGLRLWGPYPALIDESLTIVKGSIYEVPDQQAAQRLQIYETDAYGSRSCLITVKDGGADEEVEGYTFKFRGNRDELSEGTWDLDQWRRSTGRMPIAESKRKVRSNPQARG